MQKGPFLADSPALPSVPNDIFRTICKNYIPHFRLHGPQTLELVSKNWKNILNTLPKDPHYRFPASILEECKTPEDALFLLKDTSFTDYLTNKQLLGLMAKIPSLANLVIESIKLKKQTKPFDWRDITQLSILGVGNAVTAQYILENNFPFNQDRQVEIAAPHEGVAHALLSSSTAKELTSKQLALLGCNYLTVATKILENSELYSKLSEPDYAILGRENAAIKALILKHVEQAKIELSGLTRAKLLTTEANLSQPSDPLQALYESLSAGELSQIADDPVAEKYFASVPNLTRKLMGIGLYPGARFDLPYSRALARTLVEDSNVVKNENLYKLFLLGRNDKQTAEIIFNTPGVKQRLTNEPYALIRFGERHSSIGLAILKNPALYRKIPGQLIVRMVSSNFKLAKYCVDDKALRDHIGPKALAKFHKYPKIGLSLSNLAEGLYGGDIDLVLDSIRKKETRDSMQFLIKKVLQEPQPPTKLQP